jgi:hypothetical protein
MGSRALRASSQVVNHTLPKGIILPKRGAYHSSRPSAGVKIGKAIYLFPSSVQTGSGGNKASYPTVKGALQMGIKRPKRGAHHSPGTSIDVKYYRTIYLLCSTLHIGCGANTSSYPMVTGDLPIGIRRPKRGAGYSPLPSIGVKNASAIYLPSSSVYIGSGAMKPTCPTVPVLYPKG